MPKLPKQKLDISNIKEYRQTLGLNQQSFWAGLGVTQSGGSRYESGRNLPRPVALLLTLRETGKISQADIDAAAHLLKKARMKL